MLKALRRRSRGAAAAGTAADELRSALRQCRASMPILMGLGFFFNLLFMATPLYTMQLFDRVISSGRIETLVMLTIIACIALMFMGGLDAIRGMMLTRIGRWLERQLAPRLIAWTVRGKLLGVNDHVQPLRELSTIRSFVSGSAMNALADLPWAPAFFAVIWLIHPWLAAIAIFTAGILFGIAWLNEVMSRRLMKESTKLANENTRSAELAIRNADVFHAMGMLPSFLVSWAERSEQAIAGQVQAADRNSILYGISKSIRLFVQMLIMGAGAYLVIKGEMTGGGMIASSMLLGRALSPFEQSIGSWRTFLAARDATERLTKALEMIPVSVPSMRLPTPEGRISCENIIFIPSGRTEPVLNGISFDLNGGDILGIIGPSACGKSTLCRILVGVSQPSHGHARLDGADVNTWSADQLGQAVGYLPQDVELFEGTVSSNIARLQPDFDPDEVVEAAKVAGIHEMILRLPDGYDTEIGEAGGFLSGGQRQRIGLARALYGRPRFIVLDEPNASLDVEGEVSLIRAIETAKGWGATVVIVAHQPHILKPSDKLMVLRGGVIQLFGPRDEVLKNFRVMHEAAKQTNKDGTKEPGKDARPVEAQNQKGSDPTVALPSPDVLRQRLASAASSLPSAQN